MTKTKKLPKRQARIYCRFCGAKLKRDPYGKKCPTYNCQWQHGMSKEDEFIP